MKALSDLQKQSWEIVKAWIDAEVSAKKIVYLSEYPQEEIDHVPVRVIRKYASDVGYKASSPDGANTYDAKKIILSDPSIEWDKPTPAPEKPYNPRRSIYMNPPLEKLSDEFTSVGRNSGFSRRLGDIVERYTALMTCAPENDISPDEITILSAALTGSVVTPTLIKRLPEWVRDSNLPGSAALADAIEDADYLTRMMLIEAAMPT